MTSLSNRSMLGSVLFLSLGYIICFFLWDAWATGNYVPTTNEIELVPQIALNIVGIFSFSRGGFSSFLLILLFGVIAFLTSAFAVPPGKIMGGRIVIMGMFNFFFFYFLYTHAPGLAETQGSLYWTNCVLNIICVAVVSFVTSRFFYRRRLEDDQGQHPARKPQNLIIAATCMKCGALFTSKPYLCSKCGAVIHETPVGSAANRFRD